MFMLYKNAPKGAVFLQLYKFRLQQRPGLLISQQAVYQRQTQKITSQMTVMYGCVSTLTGPLLSMHYRVFV